MTVHVTVVICTWNRIRLLPQTLEALSKQRLNAPATWDVLVVDNASTDGTAGAARAWQGRLPLTVITEHQLGLSHARNRGLTEASGDLLAFLDDDALPAAGWLQALVDAAPNAPDAGVFGGPVTPWFEEPPDADLAAVFPLLARGFSGVDRSGRPDEYLSPGDTIVGANMAFRRKAIEGLRFDTDLGRVGAKLAGDEDFQFIRKVEAGGWKRFWVSAMSVEHFLPASRMTLDYLLRYTVDTAEQCAEPFVNERGKQLFDVPRWLISRCLFHYGQAWAYRIAGRRRDRLIALREHWRLRGLIRGIRSARRARRLPMPVDIRP